MNGFFWRRIFPVLYGLCIYASVRLVNDVISESRFWERHWSINAWELGTCFIVSYIYFYVLLWLMRRRLRENRVSNGSLARELGEAALYITLISCCTPCPWRLLRTTAANGTTS